MKLYSKNYKNIKKFNLIFVDENSLFQRIDNFLIKRLKRVPKRLIYRLIRIGKIRVDDSKVNPSYRVQKEDLIKIPISLSYSQDKSISIQRKNFYWIKKRILYEDSEILVLNKPSGIAVHSGSKFSFGIIEILREVYFQSKYLELIHRIDKETSGILLIAKSRNILQLIQKQFCSQKIFKKYIVLVHGVWPSKIKRISCFLEKKISQKKEKKIEIKKNGRMSETLFQIKERFASFTLMLATPITGRKHQIRLHTKKINHPIVLDKRYGNRKLDRNLKESGLKRLFLHSSSITMNHPKKLINLTFVSPIDKNLNGCLNWLRKNDCVRGDSSSE
ncbi:RluA family pseudouridine synthase [Candidatus Riesia pediculicola]|uniref:Pseudouridine synthase n=1 Tax=Riesia pediculicola (strain USDA) TaxID=515618 RepID=D4G8I0_RIEPU|nr:RluA family pseudouridine synthase [Candidatus Riesia pediculicola]ADD79719.1 ribosomal large subunit pseudouridine synthase C [Candidatus Riesia pediculicola USDA]ARC53859.1 hypothetical protein AOE55_01720 [Candidatus Riesia pediculicola]QOJ86490.1 RluA family pseudouridine synthase [Candidatus Riesia pediculicola]